MSVLSKRIKQAKELVDAEASYELRDAVEIIKKVPPVKFDETVELSFKLGVDPRHADQMVRGSVLLPHGTGKTKIVLVFAKGDSAKDAKDAGADFVGDDDLIEKIQKGWFEFDAVVATPDMMKDIAKLGKALGTKGLMPSPKAGTVTPNVKNAVTELKAGKLDFRVDKASGIHVAVGKISFNEDQIVENAVAVIEAIQKAKPSVAKGQYMKSAHIASTMGIGVRLDIASL